MRNLALKIQTHQPHPTFMTSGREMVAPALVAHRLLSAPCEAVWAMMSWAKPAKRSDDAEDPCHAQPLPRQAPIQQGARVSELPAAIQKEDPHGS